MDAITAGILVALITIVPQIVGALISRRKNTADAADVISQAALALIKPYMVELERMQGKVATLENLFQEACSYIGELYEGAVITEKQLFEAKIKAKFSVKDHPIPQGLQKPPQSSSKLGGK